MPKPFIQHLHVHQAVFSQFSDGLFSSHVGWVKPETEIFSLARERFTRRQQEYLFNEGWTNARTHEEQEQALVFFDDSLANVQAAKRLGWQAIQFRDARQASRDFQQLQGQGIHLKRSVRSFVVRAGRIGSGQSKALSSLAPLYCIAMPQADATPFCEHWPAAHRHKPLVVDIGFGMGDALASMAAQDPSHRYLGIEVHPPGVGSLLQRIHDQGLDHVRVIQHDAIEVLERVIAPDSVAAFHIYFPDPWPKKRHHKRRLVQKAFVGLLSSRLANNGYVHCATDWEPYAQWMLEVLSAQAGLRNQALGNYQRPAWRPITKFEARGLKLGHTVTDLLFRKQS
ncbi:MAG: tRNA (guanosine(46)-N7)-methyltransferase TrmB [Betaproteobacteria bacterium]|nr:tRNA (guanosine(46)-N7)-methyltransferase TrmB [Betaproteobacteria bacterium]